MGRIRRRMGHVAEEPDVKAHRLAEEIVRRWKGGKALGTPSLYNVAREVLIEELAKEAR